MFNLQCSTFIVLLLVSCANDVAIMPAEDGVCRATLRLDVASFGQQGGVGTRGVAGNTDEDRVKDLWVFQFNSQTGGLLKEPVYISESKLGGNIGEIEIDFIQNEVGESSIVCAVTNTHDDSWALDSLGQTLEAFKTYDGFKEQALPSDVCEPFLSSNLGATGYTIPMFGESAEMVIGSKTYIRVPLVRMFARVHVYVDPSYPHEMDMAISEITYHNIPRYCRIKEIEDSSEYPEDEEIWGTFEAGSADEYILYVPENMQGVADGMTDKKTAGADMLPERALAIEIDMEHTVGDGDDADIHIHRYTVYPGMDMANDFNIKRNYIYNVIIKITSDPTTDTIQP